MLAEAGIDSLKIDVCQAPLRLSLPHLLLHTKMLDTVWMVCGVWGGRGGG